MNQCHANGVFAVGFKDGIDGGIEGGTEARGATVSGPGG
jgi:hypothetical protein